MTRTVVLLMLSVSLLCTPAHATNCIFNEQWPAPFPAASVTIDVWVTKGSASTIGLTDAQLASAVSRAVTIWNEESGISMKLKFRGVTSTPSQTVVQGAITVVGQDHSALCDASVATAPTLGNPIQWGQVLVFSHYLIAGPPCSQIHWRFDKERQEIPSTDIDLIQIVMHELGHAAFRLTHVNDCGYPSNTQSIMAPGPGGPPLGARILRQWEKDYGRLVYVDRSTNAIMKVSQNIDGTSSWPLVLTETGGHYWYRAGSLSQNASFTLTAWLQEDPANGFFGQSRQAAYYSLVPFYSKILDTGLPPQPVASAMSSVQGDGIVAYKRSVGNPYFDDNVTVCFRKTQDIGETFGSESCPFTPTVIRYGITAGFDPVTKNFMLTYALRDGAMRIHVIPGVGSSLLQPVTTDLGFGKSWHAPSIACRDAASGCRIAWEDRTENGCLTWSEIGINASGVVLQGTTRQQCFLQFDTPSIGYYKKDNTYRLLFGSGNYAIYSYQMAATGASWSGTGDVWNDQTSLISFPTIATEWSCIIANCKGKLRSWFFKYNY